jgi:hypothetical protein
VQLEGKNVCVKVEVVDALLDYNILLGQSCTYAMTAVVSTVFHVLYFPHEIQIITIDHLSISHPNPSSRASTVLMIDNLHLGTVNLGVRLFPSLMGNFYYPLPVNDVKFISADSSQPKASIFQIVSFRTSYFNDVWILPSPLTSMEGIGHPKMAMPLSVVEVMYSIVHKTSANPNPAPPHEIDPILKPIWAQDSLIA